MRLTIDEVISSPYPSRLDDALDVLEDTEYRFALDYYYVLYKGLPYLIQIGDGFKVLGFTWLYGTGDTTMPYHAPTPYIKKFKGWPEVLMFFKELHKRNKVPAPGTFPPYAEFHLDDPPMWDSLKDIMRSGNGGLMGKFFDLLLRVMP